MYPSKPLIYTVSNYRASGPGGLHHRAVKARWASKANLTTLCGLPVSDLRKTAPFEVMKNRPVLGATIPADPFYGPLGCPVCHARLVL